MDSGASVVRRRNVLAKRVRSILPEDFVVVGSPDHPLVLRSVDILVGGRAGLTAVMMMTAAERKNVKAFVARWTLNRMALPPSTRFILVRSDDDPDGLVSHLFSAELRGSAKRGDAALAELISSPQRLRELPRSELAEDAVKHRFGSTYRLARALQRGSTPNRHRGQRDRVVRPTRDVLPGGIDALFFESSPGGNVLSKITFEAVENWFRIDASVPLPASAPALAAFAEMFPQAIGDPDKYVRAAAFAGLVLAPIIPGRSHADIGDLINRYTRLK